jgi:hypothetical protein
MVIKRKARRANAVELPVNHPELPVTVDFSSERWRRPELDEKPAELEGNGRY